MRQPREEINVVKGTSKRVVVIKSPDPKVFEQAFFIIREDYLTRKGQPNALKEAQQVADDYIRSMVTKPRRILRGKAWILWLSGGAVLVGLVTFLLWLIIR